MDSAQPKINSGLLSSGKHRKRPEFVIQKYQQDKARGSKKNLNPEIALGLNAVSTEAAPCPLSMPFVLWADQGFCIPWSIVTFRRLQGGGGGGGGGEYSTSYLGLHS